MGARVELTTFWAASYGGCYGGFFGGVVLSAYRCACVAGGSIARIVIYGTASNQQTASAKDLFAPASPLTPAGGPNVYMSVCLCAPGSVIASHKNLPSVPHAVRCRVRNKAFSKSHGPTGRR